MQEVNFHLRGTRLVNQGINIEVHGITVVVHIFKQWVELIDRINAVGLPGSFRPTGSSNGRL